MANSEYRKLDRRISKLEKTVALEVAWNRKMHGRAEKITRILERITDKLEHKVSTMR